MRRHLLEVALDETVADGAVHVSAAHESTATLGAMFGPITLERVMDAITASESNARFRMADRVVAGKNCRDRAASTWTRRVSDAVGAPTDRLVPYPHRSESCRAAWLVSADCGWDQAAHEGDHHAVAGGQITVLPGAGRDSDARARRVGGDSVRAWHCAGGYQRRPSVRDGNYFRRRLRRHHRGLGIELEICVLSVRCARRRRWSATKSAWASCW